MTSRKKSLRQAGAGMLFFCFLLSIALFFIAGESFQLALMFWVAPTAAIAALTLLAGFILHPSLDMTTVNEKQGFRLGGVGMLIASFATILFMYSTTSNYAAFVIAALILIPPTIIFSLALLFASFAMD